MEGMLQGDVGEYFSIGRVLGRAFNLFVAEIGKYLLLGILLMCPTVIYTLFFAATPVVVPAARLISAVQSGALVGFATFVLQAILQGTVLYGAFQQMQGKGFDLGESLKVGLGRIPALLGVSLLVGLASILGFILLIVPGIMIFCAYYVAVPVTVIERPGLMRSLSRSGELTSGSRWSIFGLILLVGLVSGLMSALLLILGQKIAGQMAGVLLQFVWQAGAASFGAVIITVAYHDLRAAKEGINVDEIAAVFD